jgi:hypothetical protein
MRNVSDPCCGENQSTSDLQYFFPKILRSGDSVEKYGANRQATD